MNRGRDTMLKRVKHIRSGLLSAQSTTVLISSTILGALFLLTWHQFSKETRVIVNQSIIEDVARLQTIFAAIDKDCTITGFDHEKNYIDFLTVKSFVSNEVGSVKLMFPEKWNGPYLPQNPTIQSKKYEIVEAQYGYYIVPGTGVRLGNGKVMGHDIIITKETDIDSLLNEKAGLEYKGKPLALLAWAKKNPPAVDLTQADE